MCHISTRNLFLTVLQAGSPRNWAWNSAWLDSGEGPFLGQLFSFICFSYVITLLVYGYIYKKDIIVLNVLKILLMLAICKQADVASLCYWFQLDSHQSQRLKSQRGHYSCGAPKVESMTQVVGQYPQQNVVLGHN